MQPSMQRYARHRWPWAIILALLLLLTQMALSEPQSAIVRRLYYSSPSRPQNRVASTPTTLSLHTPANPKGVAKVTPISLQSTLVRVNSQPGSWPNPRANSSQYDASGIATVSVLIASVENKTSEQQTPPAKTDSSSRQSKSLDSDSVTHNESNLCFLSHGGSSETFTVNEAVPVDSVIGTIKVSVSIVSRKTSLNSISFRNLSWPRQLKPGALLIGDKMESVTLGGGKRGQRERCIYVGNNDVFRISSRRLFVSGLCDGNKLDYSNRMQDWLDRKVMDWYIPEREREREIYLVMEAVAQSDTVSLSIFFRWCNLCLSHTHTHTVPNLVLRWTHISYSQFCL